MKKIILFMILSIIIKINAQEVVSCEEPSKTKSVMTNFVDEEPQFKGGQNEFLKFVDSIIVLPKEIIEEEVSGNKCYVSFIVDEKGEISNIKIARGILDCDACNIEAIRIIEQSKDKWSPAKVNGKPVKYRHIQIIKFNIKQ